MPRFFMVSFSSLKFGYSVPIIFTLSLNFFFLALLNVFKEIITSTCKLLLNIYQVK